MNIDHLLQKGDQSIAESPAIAAAVAAAEEPAVEEDVVEEVQESVVEERVDYNDRDSVVSYIEAHPDKARDALSRYERHVAGKAGSEKEQMTRIQAQIEQMQAALAAKNDPDDEDDLGLKSDNYEALDKVNQRLPGNKATADRLARLEERERIKEREGIAQALKNQYGEIFTPARERHLLRALAAAGDNLEDADFVEEMTLLGNDLKREAAKTVKTTETEQKRRRVDSSVETPGPPPRKSTAPLSVVDPRTGTVTPKTLKAWADEQIRTRPEFKDLRR